MIHLTDRPDGNGNGNHEPILASQIQQVSELRTAASVLLQRMQFLRQAGLTFNGTRDVWGVLGYPEVISTRAYVEKYLRGGVASRIIDALPNATWRGSVEVLEDRDPHQDTEFEKAWRDLDTRLQIQARLLRVDKLSQISHYACLLIGANGDLREELPKGKSEQILYLASYLGGGGPYTSTSMIHRPGIADEADITIYEYETDIASPRFGLPRSYQLRRAEISGATTGEQRVVHWSRVIHVADGCLFDEVMGLPALERVWNLLEDLEKVTGGGAEAFWLRANQGLHLNVSKDLELPDAKFAVESLKEQADEYRHQLTRWLRTRGVEVNTLGSDVANFTGPADAILTQIAGAKAIPKRILTGSEMGELASSQDRDNWKDQVNGRQTQYAGPYIVRPLVDRLIKYGYLPSPKKGPQEYEVVWPHIEVLTEEEKGKIANQMASVNSTYGDVVFTDAEIRDRAYGLEPLTDKQKEEARPEQPEPPADQVPDELVAAQDRKFSSTEVRLPPTMADPILAFGQSIPDSELAEDGREAVPHVTVKYGLHTQSADDVMAILDSEPLTLTLGKTASFHADAYDVLYVEVSSVGLKQLNKRISRMLDVTDTHPKYVPHATIAYLKKGMADRYVGLDLFDGISEKVNELVFSPVDGNIVTMPLAPTSEELEEIERVLEDALENGNNDVLQRILGFVP